ncbi:MAG: hypothetical protein M3R17_01255 [Bacteroidota bacterium]|nr:hypothetical protein [Bacteroidota bacterium]
MKKGKINLSLMLIVSAIAGTTFFFSCSKNSEEISSISPGQTNSPLSTAPYTDCSNVSNPENPYDQTGATHNDILDYVIAHQSEWPCDNAQMPQKISELTSNFICDNGYGSGADCYNTTFNLASTTLNEYASNTHEEIINSHGSAAMQGYMHELINEIEGYEDSTQIDSLLASIKQIERQVTTSTLDADEKAAFLNCSSIGRYSACYWFQETQKAQSDWTRRCPYIPSNPPAGKINWTKFGIIIACDILGYVIGNLPGAGACSSMGAAALS